MGDKPNSDKRDQLESVLLLLDKADT